MRLTYYGSRISPNLMKTPEGYLICRNVPIARTGEMEYLPHEIGVDSDKKKVVVVRDEKEVFDQAALASFEGKPVTEGHPAEDVEPSNYQALAKGHVQNVRRGTGDEEGYVLADLHITDPALINEIENGIKREVSCGYCCDYEDNGDDTYSQRHIRGNHVAVVDEGRAGKSVCIKDSKPEEERRSRNMGKQNPGHAKRKSILNLFGRAARDAKSPDEIEDLAEDAAEALKEEEVEETPAEEKKEEVVVSKDACGKKSKDDEIEEEAEEVETEDGDEGLEELKQEIADLKEMVASLAESLKAKDEEPEPEEEKDEIEETIDELEGGEEKAEADTEDADGEEKSFAEEEEEFTVPADDMREDPDEGEGGEKEEVVAAEGEVETGDEDVKQKETEDAEIVRKAALDILKAAKPAVAAISDPDERQRVTDALVRSVRGSVNTPYSRILKGSAQAARDSASASRKPSVEERQAVFDRLNPHHK